MGSDGCSVCEGVGCCGGVNICGCRLGVYRGSCVLLGGFGWGIGGVGVGRGGAVGIGAKGWLVLGVGVVAGWHRVGGGMSLWVWFVFVSGSCKAVCMWL